MHAQSVGWCGVMFAESLLPRLEAIAARATAPEGVEVAWAELKRRGSSWIFRVFIERRDGVVGLEDCERVGRRLGLLLDVEDPIEDGYTLEVSTPGLDRPLHDERDYERFTGKLVKVKTKQLLDGRRRFRGRLGGMHGATVVLEEDGRTLEIPLVSIESGRLEVDLNEFNGAGQPSVNAGERS